MKTIDEKNSPWPMIFVILFFMLMVGIGIYTVNKNTLVYMSTATGECVKVSNGKCSDIDFKNDIYEKVWVK